MEIELKGEASVGPSPLPGSGWALELPEQGCDLVRTSRHHYGQGRAGRRNPDRCGEVCPHQRCGPHSRPRVLAGAVSEEHVECSLRASRQI